MKTKMKKLLNILMLAAMTMSFALTSCDDPNYPGSGNDTGTLNTKGLQVNVIKAEDSIETRAGVDVSTFTVRIIDKNSGEVKNSYIYSEMPEVLTLPVGDYTLEVYNHQVEEAAWDSPYYYATKDFTITKNEITELGSVTCKLNNVKVSIRYTDELKALLGSDVKVHVDVANKNSLDFVYNETRSGYFKYYADNKTLVATFSGTVDGFKVDAYKVLSDVAPGQHRIITFSLKEGPVPEDASGKIGTTGLSLNATVTSVDLSVNVPTDEDTIEPYNSLVLSPAALSFTAAGGTNGFVLSASNSWTLTSSQTWCTTDMTAGDKGSGEILVTTTANTSADVRTAVLTATMGKVVKRLIVTQAGTGTQDNGPKITSSTIDLSKANVVTSASKVDVDVSAPNGIKTFVVEIISDQLTPELLQSVGLTNKFDLCNPGTYEEALKGLNLPVGSDVQNKTSLKFDISGFMPMLVIYKGTHKFKIDVTDNKGLTGTATITLTVQ
jgi:hypothetical protein